MNQPEVFVAGPDASGRLDAWLSQVSGLTRTEVQRLIASGAVTVNGSRAAKSVQVAEGTVVEIRAAEAPLDTSPLAPFEVRYEDDDLAIVFKPAGVVVHPGGGHTSGTLSQALAKSMPLAAGSSPERPGIVHRLDRDTSGLLVIAKTDDAYAALIEAMKARVVTRMYDALVWGVFALPSGKVEAPIGRSMSDRTRMTVTPAGRHAVTEFHVSETLTDMALINARLHTGRTHQIRVHLNHIGHPVIGDKTYGRGTAVVAKELGLRRMFLHAGTIELEHPFDGHTVAVEEPLPADLSSALAAARGRRI